MAGWSDPRSAGTVLDAERGSVRVGFLSAEVDHDFGFGCFASPGKFAPAPA
jgi:hypothetical protein